MNLAIKHGHPPKTTPRVVIHPGWVTSVNDHQQHYVSAPELIKLYGLRPEIDYIVVVHDDAPDHRFRPLFGDIHLRPRFGGQYERPAELDS